MSDAVVRQLLDEATAEAKRLGSDDVHEFHVLVALVRRSDDAAKELSLEVSAAQELCRKGPEPSLGAEALLQDATAKARANSTDLLSELVALFRPRVPSADVAPEVPDPQPDPIETQPAPSRVHPGPSSADQSPGASELVIDDEPSQRVLAELALAHPMPVVLHGRPGAGRSTHLRLIADLLRQHRPENDITLVTAGELLVAPQRAAALAAGSRAGDVILVDDVHLAIGLTRQHANGQLLAPIAALLAADLVGVVLTMPTAVLGRWSVTMGELAARCRAVDVPPLAGEGLHEAITLASARLTEHHRVSFDQSAVAAADAGASPGERLVHPGLAVARLDAAAASAASSGRTTVSADDLRAVDTASPPSTTVAHLAERLRATVHGQEHAIDQLANRLSLTRAGLDIRPERPDGVFLFVGPSGVGKTALARGLAAELYGDETALIRLDMSEYMQPWSVSRLTGPQPGYVGSTEPESWLTTKVRQQPHSVVLLDEIEKAHPDVWNVFLQVFDDGRLTDSRGEVADFSSTVVIMTSNLGTGTTATRSIGFTVADHDLVEHERRVRDVVAEHVRPELMNRLDATIVFRPLDRTAIRSIAEFEIERTVRSVARRGYVLDVGPGVVDVVVDDGYDEQFGARHLQRSIERNLLEPLVAHGPGRWSVVVDDGAVALIP